MTIGPLAPQIPEQNHNHNLASRFDALAVAVITARHHFTLTKKCPLAGSPDVVAMPPKSSVRGEYIETV